MTLGCVDAWTPLHPHRKTLNLLQSLLLTKSLPLTRRMNTLFWIRWSFLSPLGRVYYFIPKRLDTTWSEAVRRLEALHLSLKLSHLGTGLSTGKLHGTLKASISAQKGHHPRRICHLRKLPMNSKDSALKSANMRMSRVQNLFSRSTRLCLETKTHWLFPGNFFKDNAPPIVTPKLNVIWKSNTS